MFFCFQFEGDNESAFKRAVFGMKMQVDHKHINFLWNVLILVSQEYKYGDDAKLWDYRHLFA
jgi:hypothetical protein